MTYQLTAKWKYILRSPVKHSSPITGLTIITPYGGICSDGTISIPAGYAWDGASGPAIDTPTIIPGSLFHDFLYQCMREGVLDRKYKDAADMLLKEICLECGMWQTRANWVYWAVKSFAKRSVLPDKKPRNKIITIEIKESSS